MTETFARLTAKPFSAFPRETPFADAVEMSLRENETPDGWRQAWGSVRLSADDVKQFADWTRTYHRPYLMTDRGGGWPHSTWDYTHGIMEEREELIDLVARLVWAGELLIQHRLVEVFAPAPVLGPLRVELTSRDVAVVFGPSALVRQLFGMFAPLTRAREGTPANIGKVVG